MRVRFPARERQGTSLHWGIVERNPIGVKILSVSQSLGGGVRQPSLNSRQIISLGSSTLYTDVPLEVGAMAPVPFRYKFVSPVRQPNR